MQTGTSANTSPENFLVTRLRRNVAGRADVGVMFLNRQATGEHADGRYNRSYGVDANFRPLGQLVINSYVAGTRSPDSAGSTTAARLTVGWRDRLWNTAAFVKQVGDGFDPGVGFVHRRGMRHTYATVWAHPRPRIPFVQEVNPYVELDYITNLRSVLETQTATVGFDVQFLDGGRLGLSYNDGFELLFEPFRLLSHTVVSVGDYRFDEVTASYRSSAGRAISGQVNITSGGFFDGTRTLSEVRLLDQAGRQRVRALQHRGRSGGHQPPAELRPLSAERSRRRLHRATRDRGRRLHRTGADRQDHQAVGVLTTRGAARSALSCLP